VAKVDPRELPQAPNIVWLGQRQYTTLPSYLKAFDVCLMPFALNEATEFINPTKTLEYMAAAKPIVSTAVADVVHNFTPIVRVAHTHQEFVDEVVAAIEHPDEVRCRAGVDRAAAASWESIVQRMREQIGAVLAARAEAHTAEDLLQDDTLPVDAVGTQHSGSDITTVLGITRDPGVDAA
jgi:glycosyltransferase involved in cell wall biosynthesis